MTNYPLMQLSNTNTKSGIYKKKALLSSSFLTSNYNTFFLSQKKSQLRSLIKPFIKKDNGFHSEILFHGFNFTAKRIRLNRKQSFIDAHKSEVFICDEPITNEVKSRVYKRRLTYFSYNSKLINIIKEQIKKFNAPDTYTGKGFFDRYDSYDIKQRRKRK